MNALVRSWERTLARSAGRSAVVEAAAGAACTFADLDAGAQAWSEAHVRPTGEAALAGRAVVFGVANGRRWLEMFIALQRAGAVAVPLDGAEPLEAQRRVAESVRAGFWWDGISLRAIAGSRRFRGAETCLIKLTSGTTGQPRPLVFTAAQMLADARQVTATMGISARDLNYALIPLGHSYGLGNLTIPLLALGVPLVIGSSPLPHAIASEVARWRPTVFPTVPAVLRGLAAADVRRSDLASLRRVISAGAPLPIEVARDFAARFGQRVHSFYGSSETGGIAYDRTGAATLVGSVGTALRGVIVEPLRGQRIRVRSAAVFSLGNGRRVNGHATWIPPDHAEIASSGRMTLLGRRGTTIKLAGRRLNLGEVAARLRRLRGVRDVWVGADGTTDPLLGAVVASDRSAPDLRAELLMDTAPWKIPKRLVTLSEFPLTARGKTDTASLRARVFGTRDQAAAG
jgi:acyl-coenzyme A synthetase/AMP-(fatty) acid ligase